MGQWQTRLQSLPSERKRMVGTMINNGNGDNKRGTTANAATVFAIIARDNGNDNNCPITTTTTMSAGRQQMWPQSLPSQQWRLQQHPKPMAHIGKDHPNNGNCGVVNGNSNSSGNNNNNSGGKGNVGVDGGRCQNQRWQG